MDIWMFPHLGYYEYNAVVNINGQVFTWTQFSFLLNQWSFKFKHLARFLVFHMLKATVI